MKLVHFPGPPVHHHDGAITLTIRPHVDEVDSPDWVGQAEVPNHETPAPGYLSQGEVLSLGPVAVEAECLGIYRPSLAVIARKEPCSNQASLVAVDLRPELRVHDEGDTRKENHDCNCDSDKGADRLERERELFGRFQRRGFDPSLA